MTHTYGLVSSVSSPFSCFMSKISEGEDWKVGWSRSKKSLECLDKLLKCITLNSLEVTQPHKSYVDVSGWDGEAW